MRGYFEIGVYHPKYPVNTGTLWRSAYQLGASGLFVVGPRYQKQASDTVKAWRHLPMREFDSLNDLILHLPYSTPLIAVEMGGEPLSTFSHPERAVYLLGAEDHGLPENILADCHRVVSIEAIRTVSFNVAVAGSIVMWHRLLTRGELKETPCSEG